MFVLAKEYLFWWPVTVVVPDPERPGKHAEQSFKVRFEALPRDEANELDAAYEALTTEVERQRHEHALLHRVVSDWGDVVSGPGKEPVPYSAEAFGQAMQWPWFRRGLYAAYGEAMSGKARAKN